MVNLLFAAWRIAKHANTYASPMPAAKQQFSALGMP